MSVFFTRTRFGRPQVLAGCLLLAFLGQCAWLIERRDSASTSIETSRASEDPGGRYGEGTAGLAAAGQVDYQSSRALITERNDPNHSAFWYLTASAPRLPRGGGPEQKPAVAKWLLRMPYLAFGALLGASLWYVARRLYGNAGGYIALGLYCFSPSMIRSTAVWYSQPEVGAAWGAFGAIFTAIAVAHTLYAPREVVLWNWRRIGLLGLSLLLAVGNQFSLLLVAPLALAFMLYVAPSRRAAALVIWLTACGVALCLLLASYFFDWHAFWLGMHHADFFAISWNAYTMPEAYRQIFTQLGQSSPAMLLALPIAMAAYFAWGRTRYFGNTAPLLVSALFLLLAVGTPHYPGLGFHLAALPFLFVFVAGISADLLETRESSLALASVWGLLVANGLWNLWEVARV